jgi:hypothetical protein
MLVGKPEGKRLFRRTRHRQKDIRMLLGETGWECVDWILLCQDRDQWWALVKIIMNLQVSQKVGNFLTS